MRSSAATARNLRLLARLETTLRPDEYQLCYPQLLDLDRLSESAPGDGGADRRDSRRPEAAAADVGRGRLLARRQTNLRQPSVVQGASSWLQPADRQQQQQDRHNLQAGGGSSSNQAAATSAPAATLNGKLQQTKVSFRRRCSSRL